MGVQTVVRAGVLKRVTQHGPTRLSVSHQHQPTPLSRRQVRHAHDEDDEHRAAPWRRRQLRAAAVSTFDGTAEVPPTADTVSSSGVVCSVRAASSPSPVGGVSTSSRPRLPATRESTRLRSAPLVSTTSLVTGTRER